MDFAEFKDVPVVDCHVHFGNFGAGGAQLKAKDLDVLGEFMVEVQKKGKLASMCVTGRDAGLYLKARYPRLFYAGGFVPWSGETATLPNVNWEKYIQSLIELGYDGVGEMGNKPVLSKSHEPLDGDYYEGFWNSCESLGFPVLCHVADPEEFWDEALAPDWAKKQRWVYYLDDYPTKEELYNEMENVLTAHPTLKVTLCHFYFISGNLEKAYAFMKQFPNANLDLTLGIELMYNISRQRDGWREFFIKYQNRILFGTDIATWQAIQESVARIWLIRKFLESDEEFYTPSTADRLLTRYEEPFIGLNLPVTTLKKIYSDNFKRLWGRRPKQIDVKAAVEILGKKGEKLISDAIKNLPQE
jgi:predicted TIM-barrel fold metal-dependent hydrolase